MFGRSIKVVGSNHQLHLIVDANVLLAGLLRNSTTREIIFDSRFKFYAPEHLLLETEKHLVKSDRFRKRLNLSQSNLIALFSVLTADIIVMNEDIYSGYIKDALLIAPHKEDAPYLALALQLGIPIWSNDQGMAQQKIVKVVTTTWIVDMLKNLSA